MVWAGDVVFRREGVNGSLPEVEKMKDENSPRRDQFCKERLYRGLYRGLL